MEQPQQLEPTEKKHPSQVELAALKEDSYLTDRRIPLWFYNLVRQVGSPTALQGLRAWMDEQDSRRPKTKRGKPYYGVGGGCGFSFYIYPSGLATTIRCHNEGSHEEYDLSDYENM